MKAQMVLLFLLLMMANAQRLTSLDALRNELKRLAPPASDPLSEQRSAAIGKIDLTPGTTCGVSFGKLKRKALARTIAIFCAKVEGRPLAFVDLSGISNPLKSYNSECQAAKTSNAFSVNILDVVKPSDIDAETTGPSGSTDLIRRNILMLVNRGNYPMARNYIGALMEKIYTHMTLTEADCSNKKQENIILSMMESEISQVTQMVGLARFSALLTISVPKPITRAIVKNSENAENGSKRKELSLYEKIEELESHGCFVVFMSKTKQMLRAFPLHTQSQNCDLQALYQIIVSDASPASQMMIFHAKSSNIDMIEWQHGVAGASLEYDIQLEFYCSQDLAPNAMKVVENISSYSGGNLIIINSNVEMADYLEIKLAHGREIIFRSSKNGLELSGEKTFDIIVDEFSRNPMLEVICAGELSAVTLDKVNALEFNQNLMQQDSEIIQSGSIYAFRMDTESEGIPGRYQVTVDCEESKNLAVVVSAETDLSAFKIFSTEKKPDRQTLGRLGISGKYDVSDITIESDDGSSKAVLDMKQSSNQIISMNFQNMQELREMGYGPAWAHISLENTIRLKRTSIPMFAIQDNIEGLVLEPGEMLEIQFLCYNEYEEYSLSAVTSNTEWIIATTKDTTDTSAQVTSLSVRVFSPITTKGIDVAAITLAASNQRGRTISTFMMVLISNETPEIPPERIENNVEIIQRMATTYSKANFYNPRTTYGRRETIFSVMISPHAFVRRLAIKYDGKEFSSRIKPPNVIPTNFNQSDATFGVDNMEHDSIEMQPDDPGIYQRSFELNELVSSGGERLSLVKLHHDKNRLTVKTVIDAGKEIEYLVVVEELLERTRFKYTHTTSVSQEAKEYHYQLLLEDARPLKFFNFGPATNRFFREESAVITDVGAKTAMVSHTWTPDDNKLGGYDPFSTIFAIEYDVDHPKDIPCDLHWTGDEKDFISRCRIKDVFVNRPVHAIFLMDTSGSMWGRRIQQARDVFNYMLRQLHPSDKFNVMRFSNEEEMMTLDNELLSVTPESIEEANQFLDKSSTGGGTNIYTALVRALITVLSSSSGFAVPNIFILTDGEATTGVTDPEVIFNTLNYVRSSRKIHINAIALGSDVNSSLLKRITTLGEGEHIHIGESANEMFDVARFYRSAISNSMGQANWGVQNIKVDYEMGIQPDSLTKTEFDSLVPGNEVICAGRLEGDGDSIVKVTLSYLALGTEQASFTKYHNQAASRLNDGQENWGSFSTRARRHLEIHQLLDEWHQMADDGDRQKEIQEYIVDQSILYDILTPMVVLQVSKPALKQAMNIMGRLKRSTDDDAPEPGTIHQDIKHRFRGLNSKKFTKNPKTHGALHYYTPVMCGTSDLVALPAETVPTHPDDAAKLTSDYVCFSSAELEFEQMTIHEEDGTSIEAFLRYGQIYKIMIFDQQQFHSIVMELDHATGQSHVYYQSRDGMLLDDQSDDAEEDHVDTEKDDLEFGSQIFGSISASHFANFTYIHFGSAMIGLESIDESFHFEIGIRSDFEREEETNRSNLDRNKRFRTTDLTCFGHHISLSECSSHEIIHDSHYENNEPIRSRHGRYMPRSRSIDLATFLLELSVDS